MAEAPTLLPYVYNPDSPPPRRLTTDMSKPHFHPCYILIGVIVNGVDRNDVVAYDQDAGHVLLRSGATIDICSIEPRWEREASRQVRRSIQRWEQNRR